MKNTAKIQQLSSIATALLQASVIVDQAALIADPLVVRDARDTLFNMLPMDELSAKIGETGFEQVPDIIACINTASHEFLRGDTQAIRISTAFVKNDHSGNDHTAVTLAFSASAQSVLWTITLVETRDHNAWETEVSTLDDVHRFLFCGEQSTPELYEFLLETLEGVADAYLTQNVNFPYYASTEEVETAQALIAKHQSLLDSLAA